MEFERTGRFYLMYIKSRNSAGKKTMGFETLALKTLKAI
jgi:hypothetical protein